MTPKEPEYKANLLFSLLNNYPIEGNEASLKLFDKTFYKIRFLFGIKSENFTITKLSDICYQIKMPENFVERLTHYFPESNSVLFGFEEYFDHCIYKVYLEFWEKNRQLIQHYHHKCQPLTQYIGFKWNAFDNHQNIITKYVYHPFISLESIIENLEKIYRHCNNKESFEIVRDIVNFSAKQIHYKNDSFIYLQSSDNSGMRNSFDINVYKAGLTIKALNTYIKKIQNNYDIESSSLQSFIQKIQNKIFGHLSGGIDNQGRDFLTIYYEI